ncbi:MAG: hypothetical protein AAGF23_14865, partial [Acidobacteriota bacterium]
METARGPASTAGEADAGIGRTAVSAARRASAAWGRWTVPQRLAVIRRLRRRIAERPLGLAATATLPWRSSTAETL